jgi:hypothetical protein
MTLLMKRFAALHVTVPQLMQSVQHLRSRMLRTHLNSHAQLHSVIDMAVQQFCVTVSAPTEYLHNVAESLIRHDIQQHPNDVTSNRLVLARVFIDFSNEHAGQLVHHEAHLCKLFVSFATEPDKCLSVDKICTLGKCLAT